MTIRMRLVVLAGVAIVLMGLAAWLGFAHLDDDRLKLEREDLRNLWFQDCLTLIHYLQRERGASSSFHASGLNGLDIINKARSDSDTALGRIFDNPLTRQHWFTRSRLSDLRINLMQLRKGADRENGDWRSLRDAYTASINLLLGAVSYEIPPEAGNSSAYLDVIAELALARESLGLIRTTFNSMRNLGQQETGDLLFIGRQLTDYRHHIGVVKSIADRLEITSLRNTLNTPDYLWTFGVIDQLMANREYALVIQEDGEWWMRSTKVIDAFKQVENDLFDELEHQSSEKIKAQRLVMRWIVGAVTLSIVLLVIFVAMSVSRMIQGLRELSAALDQIVEKGNYAIRLNDRGGRDELGHAFKLFNWLLESTDKLIREKETLASVDILTGVMNRRAFMKYAEREITRATRYGHALSVLFLDIDHFKRVNDTFGHTTGDAVLKLFVTIVMQRIRGADLISRWGGEEFIVMAPDTNEEEAVIFAESIRLAVSSAEFPEVGHITCSLGVSQWKAGESFESLFGRVDKEIGRAHV
jgi:diguanylate cyclase (GGDEF)-like protein